MNDRFIAAFRRFKFLHLSDLLSLYKTASIKSFKKGEFIAREGEYCPYVFLILKGIIRIYILTPEATERTVRLSKEKDFTACGDSFLRGNPSREYMEAIEDCTVIIFKTKLLDELAKENIRIQRLMYEGLKEGFWEAITRIEFFTILTPEQRYRRLIDESPELLQRVPQKYLASYLGITTVSLSRIRNRKG